MSRIRLKEILAEKNLTMAKVARQADMAYNTIHTLCTHPYHDVNLYTLNRIAEVIGVHVSLLLEEETQSGDQHTFPLQHEKQLAATSLPIAWGISPANKALTIFPGGAYGIVERDFSGKQFNYHLIGELFDSSVTHNGLTEEQLWSKLSQKGITENRSVWHPIGRIVSILDILQIIPPLAFLRELRHVSKKQWCTICGEQGDIYTHPLCQKCACFRCWKAWTYLNNENNYPSNKKIISLETEISK